MATLFSIFFVVIFTLFFQASTTLGFLPIMALVVGAIFLLMTPLIKGLTLLPLQAASVETSSQALRFARRDWKLVLYTIVWVTFAIFSFFVAVFSSDWLFVIWAVWLGLAIDAIYLFTYRITGYADPLQLTQTFLENGKGYFSEKNLKELCTTIDGLGEISMKAVYQRSLPLAIETITKLETLAENYLEAKSKETEDVSASVNYTLGFLLHRFKMIFDIAAEDHIEPLANQIVLSTSKLAMAVAHFDPTLTSLPLHFLESFFRTARENELKEVSINSSIILYEVARTTLEQTELREGNIGGFLVGLIEQMEGIAKEAFQEDKNTPISLLTDPFRELKLMIETQLPPFSESPMILADLDRVLVEFQALESVLKSIPNIPGFSEIPEEAEEVKE
ncbi:MAG: hypothetical protein K940chlam3_01144 [Chlamydiae bacterium]|nr:hypothetical protein [Chlamydiota bacterium]